MDLLDHLSDRHLQIERYSGVYLDHDEEVVTFLLWNLSCQLCGFQQYRPGADKKKKNCPRDGKYYTIKGDEGQSKKISLWGIETLEYRKDILFITEGIFDAVRLHNFDIPAIAIMGSSYKPYKEWLLSSGRKIYKVSDDHASKLGPYPNLDIGDYEDLGEMDEESIKDSLDMLGIIY